MGDLFLHLVHSSREVEDEREGSLPWPDKSADHLLIARRNLNIGASDYQVALCKWIRHTLSGPQKIHYSSERLR